MKPNSGQNEAKSNRNAASGKPRFKGKIQFKIKDPSKRLQWKIKGEAIEERQNNASEEKENPKTKEPLWIVVSVCVGGGIVLLESTGRNGRRRRGEIDRRKGERQLRKGKKKRVKGKAACYYKNKEYERFAVLPLTSSTTTTSIFSPNNIK